MTLGIVTCTTDEARSHACIQSWRDTATTDPRVSVLLNGGRSGTPYLGTVPAFRHAVDEALRLWDDVDVIACLHDDLEIHERGWDATVLRYFARYPAMGLAGFGGAKRLGARDLYQTPYDPMQLARSGFRSNLVDAEVHGIRSLLAEPVACLDGFSQIGRRDFWEGYRRTLADRPGLEGQLYCDHSDAARPWTILDQLGFIHHFYDGALGCLANRYGWQTWYLPIRCRHLGGQTAVGDPGYQHWATTQHPEGDHGFWTEAHQIGYAAFKDVLPLEV